MSSQVEVLADRVRVGFRIPYRPALIEQLRSLFKQNKGYWAPDLKAWVVPAETAYSVARGLGQLPAFSANNARLHVDEKGRQTRAGAREPGDAKGQTGY
jgi:hypothetical protein